MLIDGGRADVCLHRARLSHRAARCERDIADPRAVRRRTDRRQAARRRRGRRPHRRPVRPADASRNRGRGAGEAARHRTGEDGRARSGRDADSERTIVATRRSAAAGGRRDLARDRRRATTRRRATASASPTSRRRSSCWRRHSNAWPASLADRELTTMAYPNRLAGAGPHAAESAPASAFATIRSRDGWRDTWGSTYPAAHGTAILASGGGRVLSAGFRGPYGNAIVIDHGEGLQTLYGHCSKLYVRAGELVMPQQKIAAVGSTGRSTGPAPAFRGDPQRRACRARPGAGERARPELATDAFGDRAHPRCKLATARLEFSGDRRSHADAACWWRSRRCVILVVAIGQATPCGRSAAATAVVDGLTAAERGAASGPGAHSRPNSNSSAPRAPRSRARSRN